MKRRNFVASVLAGSVAAPTLMADDKHDHDREHDEQLSGPQAAVTVSFGQWKTSALLDRFVETPITANNHMMLPFEAQVKVGGSVNFVISGFHILTIYGPGTKLEDVNGTLTQPIPGAPTGFPMAVNDPLNRVYRGNNPISLPQDRTEAVSVSAPGRYLVVCTFVPHFNERMHGFVNVVK